MTACILLISTAQLLPNLTWLLLTAFPGSKLRVGQRPGREQENGERHNPRREHESWTRQVQDPQTDPVREHQTAHRRVRVHVMLALTHSEPTPLGPSAWTAGLPLLSCFLCTQIKIQSAT